MGLILGPDLNRSTPYCNLRKTLNKVQGIDLHGTERLLARDGAAKVLTIKR